MKPLVRRRQPRITGFFQLEIIFIAKNLRELIKIIISIFIVVFNKFGFTMLWEEGLPA